MRDPRRVPRRAVSRSAALLALVAAVSLVAAGCGSSRNNSNNNTNPTTPGATNGGGSTSGTVIDASKCPAGTATQGISGDTIKLGTSLPQSGAYSAFAAILKGEQAYFDNLNAQGGVEVAGKKYKIDLVNKDDQYLADKTVQNVTALTNADRVFALFNVVGTKNNLAIRNRVNSSCIPNLLIASGAVQWGNRNYPFMLGSELVPYPDEMQTFYNYLTEKKPDGATIAVLAANDDFGQSYLDSLQQLTAKSGGKYKIVATEKYDPETGQVTSQVTKLAASKADAFVVGATLTACPAALGAAKATGWKPITYMSGTCVSKLLLNIAGDAANGVLTVTPLLDPADPKNASNPAMQAYMAGIKQYGNGAEADDGIVAYGWTTAALMADILKRSPKLDRATVMETARTLSDVKDVGLQIPSSTWNTNANDWFLGETFQLIQWDAAAKHSNAVGGLTNLDGKTAELSPQDLLNQ